MPEWRRLTVNGRQNWSPLVFIDHVIDQDAEFVLHVDEDCFLANRTEVLSLVEQMRQNSNIVAAGIPDGGYFYRVNNAAALNLFFVLFRLDALREAWSQRESWSSNVFDSRYRNNVLDQRPELDLARISWNNYEPYYPLFWYLLSRGGQFIYLEEQLNRSRWSSLVVAQNGNVIAEHLWYLRYWFSRDIMTGHYCPNRTRYKQWQKEILWRYKADPRFLLALARYRLSDTGRFNGPHD